MSEAVAIISVSASAVVGISGVVAAAWSSSRERRWQSREERAIELRTVLEDGGSLVAELLLLIDEAHDGVGRDGRLGPDSKVALERSEKRMVLAMNRVGVRRGPKAPEYKTLGKYWIAVSEIVTILDEAQGEGLDSEQARAYSTAWDKAIAAETAFHEAAAKALGWEGPLPRWRQLLALSRSEPASGR